MSKRPKVPEAKGTVSMTYSGHVREVGTSDADDILAVIETTAGRIVLRGLSTDYARRLAAMLYRPCAVTVSITQDLPMSGREP